MCFQVEETVTWQDWDAYRIAHTLHGRIMGPIVRGVWRVSQVLGLAMAVFGAVLIVMSLIAGRLDLLTALGAALVYFGVWGFRIKSAAASLQNSTMARKLQKTVPESAVCFTFEEEGFSVQESSGNKHYTYSALADVWEDMFRWYLIFPQTWRVVQKNAFTEGDAAEFSAFLESKTGKAVKNIK